MAARQLNYTTVVPASRTVGECTTMLAEHGANQVSVRYADKQPVGLAFELTGPAGRKFYLMPVNSEGVLKRLVMMSWPASMVKSGQAKRFKTEAHALDVAWRVVRDWLEVQLAMIEAQVIDIEQVMLPYLQIEPGLTVYDALTQGRAAIMPGSPA